ncbi:MULTISPECIES: fimbrial protein [Burkholderia]|jgi:Tfp pilus assembly protein PilN|nr:MULTISPECIES: fimbrial protein [Burkholderia]UTP21859.1 fimbrial protein [Burkholderia sp. FXe9]MCA7909663.1 fimbrial protein [Burkholderia contaminans]MCA8190516.1 fimbrial protein [Burkholderia contaminans]MCA8368711.1 fimbrial protein [Burkholderia contaminans]MCQ4564208.1 fimbrial protein [Burkholderia contaminans]
MTACRAEPGGFNLLPYRERLAQALRRRRAAQCGAAILFGALGVGLWAGVVTGARWRVDAERESVEARLRQLQPQVGAATRAAKAAAVAAQRDAQAAALAAPYRHVAGLLAALAQVRDGTVRLDALRTTSAGAVIDARAASYRAAARWLAGMAREQRGWRIDIDVLKPASDVPVVTGGMPFRFSVRLRWHDAVASREAPGGGA